MGAQGGDRHVHKYRYSAFMGSNLDMLLRSQGIGTVVVCGTAANACVDSTVRDASQLDYNVVVCADLTGYTDERLGTVSLENLDRHFAIVCDAADVLTRVAHTLGTDAGGMQ
ncbi:MAG: isochorismatase family cysteine hydrolase [Gammaproteobacteria bacterium]